MVADNLAKANIEREFTIIPHTQSNQSTKPKGKNNNKHSLSDRRIGSKQFIQWRRRLVLVCPAIDRLQLHLACILELGHHFTQMRIVKENAQHQRHTRLANKWQPQFASRPASQSCTWSCPSGDCRGKRKPQNAVCPSKVSAPFQNISTQFSRQLLRRGVVHLPVSLQTRIIAGS